MKLTNLLSVVMLTLSATSIPAFAEDGKVYPGVMCQKSLGVGSYGGGEVRNDSTSGSLTVECPIVRDSVFGNIQDAQVRVHRANASSAIWCTLHAKSFWGTSGHQQFKSASTGGNYKTLNFNAMLDVNNAPYHIWCAIPPSKSSGSYNSRTSRLIGYRLDEQ